MVRTLDNAPKDSVTLIDHSTGSELNMPLLEGTVDQKLSISASSTRSWTTSRSIRDLWPRAAATPE